MTLKEMRETVKKELVFIPRGPEPQNLLRAVYWLERMHSLGKKAEKAATALEVLQSSIQSVKNQTPDYANFEFQYDRQFFEGKAADSRFYRCKVIPKPLDEDPSAVKSVGRTLLRLRDKHADKWIGRISFEGIARERSTDKLLDLINGNDSRPALFKFARSDYTRDRLASLLRACFPRKLVQDVTVDGVSIFGQSRKR